MFPNWLKVGQRVRSGLALPSAAGGEARREAESAERRLGACEPTSATNSADPNVYNAQGAALCRSGRFKEAEQCFRRATELSPDSAEAHSNLGYVLRVLGRATQSETSIRRALECNRQDVGLYVNLGHTLLLLGKAREAEGCFVRALEERPDDLGALLGAANIASAEGRFVEAEAKLKQILARNANMPGIWALLVSLRKMTRADSGWLAHALELADSGVGPSEQADLRFAIGKYWDDLGNYAEAFRSYQLGNELLRSLGPGYNRAARTSFVDDMVRIYTREVVAETRASGHSSSRPVFVVGMPRSGTSLVEQIIASHPAAAGAGELGFWTEVLLTHVSDLRRGPLSESTKARLAASYLELLNEYSKDAQHVVDKAPVNSEYLGFIHSVFPNARIIYMRRNAVDTCLSCYFQRLSPGLSYTMELGDLAHYYREHHRQIMHWRKVLPGGAILDVPYEELVARPEEWARRILEFIGLEWDVRCLDYRDARRPVVTASGWQVRQKIYTTSRGRWRNYEQFIEPLLALQELG